MYNFPTSIMSRSPSAYNIIMYSKHAKPISRRKRWRVLSFVRQCNVFSFLFSMRYQDVDINGRARLEVGSDPGDHGDDDDDDDDADCDGYGRSRRRSSWRSRDRRRGRPWWRKTAVQDVAQTELETIQESSDPGHGGGECFSWFRIMFICLPFFSSSTSHPPLQPPTKPSKPDYTSPNTVAICFSLSCGSALRVYRHGSW